MMGYFLCKSELLLKMLLIVMEDQDHQYDLDVFADVLQTGLYVLMMTYMQNVIQDIEDERVSLVDLEKRSLSFLFIYINNGNKPGIFDRIKNIN